MRSSPNRRFTHIMFLTNTYLMFSLYTYCRCRTAYIIFILHANIISHILVTVNCSRNIVATLSPTLSTCFLNFSSNSFDTMVLTSCMISFLVCWTKVFTGGFASFFRFFATNYLHNSVNKFGINNRQCLMFFIII